MTSQSDDDIDTFSNLTLDHTVSAEFIRKNANGRYDVKLKVNGISVVFDDKGRKDPGLHVDVKEAASQEKSAVAAAASDYSTALSPAVIVEFNDKLLRLGVTEKIFVCYVVTAQEFYCQLSRENDELFAMMDILEEYYGSQPPGKDSLISLVAGVPCAAKYSVDGCWYRAALQALQGPTQAKVSFVDYGNMETVEIKDLKILRDEFLEYPKFALRCGLIGDVASPVDFESNVMDKEFDLKVVGMNGNTHIVDLVNDGKSLSDDLLGKKANVEVINEAVKNSFVKKAEARQNEEEDDRPRFRNAEVKKGMTLEALCTFVKENGELSCQLFQYEEDLSTLMDEISTYSDSRRLSNISIDMACIALYDEDESWYRAKILKSDDRNATVKFVDYGNEAVCALENLREIRSKDLGLPVTCVDCKISGIDMGDDVVAAIEENCIDKELIFVVKDVINEELVLADVQLMGNNESICDIVNKQIVQAKSNTGEIQISKTSDIRRVSSGFTYAVDNFFSQWEMLFKYLSWEAMG